MNGMRIDPMKLVVEGLVIVASILLAFALDAWWQDRGEARIEQDMLAALQSELDGALYLLDKQLEAHAAHAQATLALADKLFAEGDGSTVPVDDQVFVHLLNNPTFDPPSGIAGALLASGQTSVLTNAELRAALGRWPAAVADGYEDQAMLLETGSRYLAPLLQRSVVSMRNAYAANADQESRRRFRAGKAGTEAMVTASPELWNALYARHARITVAMADLGRTREQLVELIDLVGGELD